MEELQGFLHYTVRQLVEYPDDVHLNHRQEGDKTTFVLSMHKSDVGRLIGKGGATVRAIRDLLTAAAEKSGQKVALEILD